MCHFVSREGSDIFFVVFSANKSVIKQLFPRTLAYSNNISMQILNLVSLDSFQCEKRTYTLTLYDACHGDFHVRFLWDRVFTSYKTQQSNL